MNGQDIAGDRGPSRASPRCGPTEGARGRGLRVRSGVRAGAEVRIDGGYYCPDPMTYSREA